VDPILIVGAGPTGLVLAIELARRGVPHVLIDQRPKPQLWDRAALIKTRTLEILAALGLSSEFLARGTAIRGVDLYSPGSRRASFRFQVLDTPFPLMLGLSEGVTEEILTGELERLGGGVKRGVEFVDLAADDRAIRVRIRENGVERIMEPSWLVGADGLHSKVRDAVGIEFPGHDYDRQWGVADLRFAHWPHEADLAAVMFDPLLIPVPIGGNVWRAYFRADPAVSAHQIHIARCLDKLAPGATVASSDEPQLFHTHSRIATRFRSGRVLLAGDAAHACSPIEGHGMNGGIQDAFNLGWKLALVATGKAPDALLDSYDVERRAIAKIVCASGDDAEANAAQGDPAAIDAAATGLATAEGQYKAAFGESELGLGYDASPILGSIGPEPLSQSMTPIGYRLGDAGPLTGPGDAIRLHELIAHTAHTLFVTIGEGDGAKSDEVVKMARHVADRFSPHVKAFVVTRNANASGSHEDFIVDATGTAHSRLGGDAPSLCLIRPDGHLGLRLMPPSLPAVEAYFARILVRGRRLPPTLAAGPAREAAGRGRSKPRSRPFRRSDGKA
jgi:2-polyprenyl-6-methoxyphenol hydroxylase-like FAD-dependent oxidoreductase